MLDGDIIGEARTGEELVTVLRARKAALALSDAALENLAGMTPGSVSKYLAPVPTKGITSLNLPLLLAALALKIIIAIDEKQAARVSKRWEKKRTEMDRPAKFTVAQARPLVLARAARKAAKARWEGKSPEDRKAHSRMMHAAKVARMKVLARKKKAA